MPLPCSFLFLQKGVVKPGILNWPTGNDSSSLVSDMTKMSAFLDPQEYQIYFSTGA